MPESGNERRIICPKCGRFALKGRFEQVETICNDPECRTSFVVEVTPDGSTSIRILPPRQKIRA